MDDLLRNLWNRLQEYAPLYFPIHDAVRDHFSQLDSCLDTVLTTSQVFHSTPEVAKDIVHRHLNGLSDIHAVIIKLIWLQVNINAIHDHTPISYITTQHFKLWEVIDEIIKLAMKDTDDNYVTLLRDYRLGRLPKVHDMVLQSVAYDNQCKAIRELLSAGAVATLKKNHHFTQHTFRNFCIPCAKTLIKYALFESYEDTRPIQRYWSQYKFLKSYIEDCLRQLRGFCDEKVNDVPIIQFIWMPYKVGSKLPVPLHMIKREPTSDDESDSSDVEVIFNGLPEELVAENKARSLAEANSRKAKASTSRDKNEDHKPNGVTDVITDTPSIVAVLKILEEQQHTVYSSIIMENLKRKVDREVLTNLLETTNIYCYDSRQQMIQLPMDVISIIGKLLSFNTMASLIAAYTVSRKPASECEPIPGSSKERFSSEFETVPGSSKKKSVSECEVASGSSKKRQSFNVSTSSKKQHVAQMPVVDDGPIATRLRQKKR